MPRRLALLIIAWLASVPALFAQGQGVAPAGFHGMPGPAPGAMNYQRQAMLEAQLVPARPDPFYEETPLDLAIGNTLAASWLHTEYLYYRLRDPGTRLVGAVPATVVPGSLIPAIDRVGGVRPGVLATTTSLERATLDAMNGMRLTFGLPTEAFTFEGSFWGLAEKKSSIDNAVFFNSGFPLPGPVIPVIPLTRGGVASDLDYVLFDGGMNTTLSAALYATEANFVFNPITPNVATEVSPIIGFGYMNFRHELDLSGEDLGSGTFHRIESLTNNNIFGPQVGLRFEAKGKWITFGAQPKFMFGINRNHSQVSTSQIFTPAELDRQFEDETTRFTPTIDLKGYAKFHLKENLSLTLGYDFTAMNGVSLSDRQIVWDSSTVLTAPPQIGMDTARHTYFLHGLNVGLDWRF